MKSNQKLEIEIKSIMKSKQKLEIEITYIWLLDACMCRKFENLNQTEKCVHIISAYQQLRNENIIKE